MRLSTFTPLLLSLLSLCQLQNLSFAAKQSYIVYMGEPSYGPAATQFEVQKTTASHFDLLGSLSESSDSVQNIQDEMIYSYSRSINGFAAVLNEAQVEAIKNKPGVVSVFLNQERKLHTTQSWDFLGLGEKGQGTPNSLWQKANQGEDVIIANLDSGVWPESRSFNDEGMGPVPPKWKGVCTTDGNFTCNRKLIGARYFNKGFAATNGPPPPEWNTVRDVVGHGSHTLSTAGGSFVPGVNVFGMGNGTAKGGSPKARVAAYKVCWPVDSGGCFDADILAGIDAAIADGVDVISVSLGGDSPVEFNEDALSLGSFNAMKKGIPVIASGGNSGPAPETVTNVSPWLFTIGASTIDREFANTISLGNKKSFKGSALSDKTLPAGKFYPLINAGDAALGTVELTSAQQCENGTLDPKKVAGKIIVCLRGDGSRIEMGHQAEVAGAVGMILANNKEYGNERLADAHVIPTSHVTFTDGQAIMSYISSTKNPTASISATQTEQGVIPSPVMAAFSSRGPNKIEPGILKPDVTAPGVQIIAAYTEATGPAERAYDKRRTPYLAMAGTSMACPHVSGIIGLLKAIHPDWSPAALRSAVMTTAKTRGDAKKGILDSSGLAATPFAYGAGHVNPNSAADPGLVYDLTVNDYLNFLCAHGYNETSLQAFSNGTYTCPKQASFANFNYPSITVTNLIGPVTITRRVKNVGAPGTYKATVRAPPGVSVVVEPPSLTFTKIGTEQIFKVAFKPAVNGMPKDYAFGQLTWSDGKHLVKSPLVVKHL